MSDKLRYYRYKKSLLQMQVADYIGIDRTTYLSYEAGMDCYPLDKLTLIAELFEIEITDLLDDYHQFLFNGQGQQVLTLRKSNKLTQREFGAILDVNYKTVSRYEKEQHRMSRNCWQRYMAYAIRMG